MQKNIFFTSMVAFILTLSAISMANAAEDSEYIQYARDRHYVGGPDESDLKVQLKLVPNDKTKNADTPESEEGF